MHSYALYCSVLLNKFPPPKKEVIVLQHLKHQQKNKASTLQNGYEVTSVVLNKLFHPLSTEPAERLYYSSPAALIHFIFIYLCQNLFMPQGFLSIGPHGLFYFEVKSHGCLCDNTYSIVTQNSLFHTVAVAQEVKRVIH